MKVVAITQARMGSSRLPGKVLMNLQGRPMLAHHVERVSRARLVNQVVVATTDRTSDDTIAAFCKDAGFDVFRGDEADVLSRYAGAAQAFSADVVVRVTSDCPLIDPEVIDRTIGLFLEKSPDIDYVSNRLVPSFPRGLDTEVFSRGALDKAAREATLPDDREHVTLYIWRQPNRFLLADLRNETDLSHLRWTVDEPADFELVSQIFAELWPSKPRFGLADCLDLLIRRPELLTINSHIQQWIPEIVRDTYGRKV